MIKLNDYIVKPTIFPDGTSQVWKLPEELLESCKETTPLITWQFENEAELIHLAQLREMIDYYNSKTTLYLPYLPYGRQDKLISNANTFALYTFARVLNRMFFNEVICDDPHSDVARKSINNFIPKYPAVEVYKTLGKLDADLICYPDKGAVEKYKSLYAHDFIFADKIRDQASGEITGMELHGDAKDRSILVVDDICDAGGTFIKLSKILYDSGAKEVNLFVTHGLFTKGTQVLRDAGIKRIFTKNGEVK